MRMRDEASDELQAYADDEAWIRFSKPLERLTLTEREQCYKAAARDSEYRGAMRLMGPEPGNPSGFASYGTAPYGDETSMALRPHNEKEIQGDSDNLMDEAQRIVKQAAPGYELADLAGVNPELHAQIMRIAAQDVNYRGPAGPDIYRGPVDPNQ